MGSFAQAVLPLRQLRPQPRPFTCTWQVVGQLVSVTVGWLLRSDGEVEFDRAV